MFGLVRRILQHKVGVVAVVALGVVMFTRDGGDEDKRPASPWSIQSAQSASSAPEDESMIGSAIATVTNKASEFIDEETGIDPAELKEQTVDSFDNTAEAYRQANERR